MSEIHLGLELGQAQTASGLLLTERERHDFTVRALSRWEAGAAYTRIADEVTALVGKLPETRARLFLDITGLGLPDPGDSQPPSEGAALRHHGGHLHLWGSLRVATPRRHGGQALSALGDQGALARGLAASARDRGGPPGDARRPSLSANH